ncbi:hypothetical protein [Bradyrhizobium valentinum]|uniref:hypothetical protein n=1 Tax=Bradyrhizobium valentinum TaxID=1518501 RepID=UPI0018D23254|nr:hypothetical protein [Bradyrhizobium valentinum]
MKHHVPRDMPEVVRREDGRPGNENGGSACQGWFDHPDAQGPARSLDAQGDSGIRGGSPKTNDIPAQGFHLKDLPADFQTSGDERRENEKPYPPVIARSNDGQGSSGQAVALLLAMPLIGLKNEVI